MQSNNINIKYYTCISHSKLSDNYILEDEVGRRYSAQSDYVKRLILNPRTIVTNLKINSDTGLPYIDTSTDDKVEKTLTKAKMLGLPIIDLHTLLKDTANFNEIDLGKVYLIKKSRTEYIVCIKNTLAKLDAFFLFLGVFDNKDITLKLVGGHGILDAYTSFNSVKLKALDFKDFDSSNIVSMDEMFFRSKIGSLDLEHLNTSSVQSMDSMFLGCETDSIDISNFDMSNVLSMTYMLVESNAKQYNLGKHNLQNCKDMSNLLYKINTDKLDMSGWDITREAYKQLDFPPNIDIKPPTIINN